MDFPETSESLIVRVRDAADRAAWSQFEQIYRPVIFRIARARGLQYSDAMDVCQQVLWSVSDAMSRYEKRDQSVRFRHWLSRITRNAILKSLTRSPRDRAVGGTDAWLQLDAIPGNQTEADQLIEVEYQRELYRQAAARVRAEIQQQTWLAFEMSVLQEVTVQETADRLEMSFGSVYAARSRVIRRLRDAIEAIEIGMEQNCLSQVEERDETNDSSV